MNWMVDEILEELRSMVRMYESAKKRCEGEGENFKDVYHTNDKFEATKSEYWRSRGIMCEEIVNDIQGLIYSINDMIGEDIRETEEAEEFDREQRGELPW